MTDKTFWRLWYAGVILELIATAILVYIIVGLAVSS